MPELLRRIHASVKPAEVIVVDDDSPDRTWEVAEGLKATYPALQVLRRIGVKGLSSAVTDGCDTATGDILVVMDSDLQHDPAIIGQLAAAIESGAGIAVASRYREGGSVGEWVRGRRWLSNAGTWLAQKLPNVETSDPMSGFFAVRADLYRSVRSRLQPEGFKILFEILAAIPRGTKLAEVPLTFQPRLHGESKLSLAVQLQFVKQAVRIGLRRTGLTGARLFAVVCIVCAALFLLRVWFILPLLVHASIRQELPTRLQMLADERGWLLSDMYIDGVYKSGSALIMHRDHRRGDDGVETCVDLQPSGSYPCND